MSNIELNRGSKGCTLIVVNSNDESSINCNNYIGNICGFNEAFDIAINEREIIDGNIFSIAQKIYLYTKSS